MAQEKQDTEKARRFWEQRYSHPLTSEDTRQIRVNITAFFSILQEWNEKNRDAGFCGGDTGLC